MRMRSLSDGDGSSLTLSGELKKRPKFQYSGWVFHLGTNKIGHEYCHPRFLFIRGKYVEMYKRDPHENPGIVCNQSSIINVVCCCCCFYFPNSSKLLI